MQGEHSPAGEGSEQTEIDAGLRGRLLGLGRHQLLRRRAPGHQALHSAAAQAERRAGQPACAKVAQLCTHGPTTSGGGVSARGRGFTRRWRRR